MFTKGDITFSGFHNYYFQDPYETKLREDVFIHRFDQSDIATNNAPLLPFDGYLCQRNSAFQFILWYEPGSSKNARGPIHGHVQGWYT